MKKFTVIAGKSIAIIALALTIGFIMLFMSIFIVTPNTFYLIPLLIGIYTISMVLIVFKLFDWMKHRVGKKMFYGVTAVIAIGALAFASTSFYKESLDRVDAEVDLDQYMPFEKGTKAVKLDEPATLQLQDNLPILDGATALYPVYSAFAQAVYPEGRYEVYDGEVMSNMTDVAYSNLIHGEVDVIFVAGPSKHQLQMAEDAGKELQLTPIGKESFVFFVNSKNKVADLTLDEIKGIYSGKITNWKEIGGKKKAIRAFQRPEDSGSQTALQNLMGDTPIMDAPVENVVGLMGGIINEVSTYHNYDNAIGFTYRYYSTQMVQNDKIRLLKINGIEPNVETIRSGEYPITGELYAVTAGSENPHIDELIDWILSEQGQAIIEKTGYVSIE